MVKVRIVLYNEQAKINKIALETQAECFRVQEEGVCHGATVDRELVERRSFTLILLDTAMGRTTQPVKELFGRKMLQIVEVIRCGAAPPCFAIFTKGVELISCQKKAIH